MSLAVISTSNAFKASSGSASETDSPRLLFRFGLSSRVIDGRTSVQVDVDDDMAAVVGDHGGGRVLGVSRGRDAAERCCGYGHGDERLQRPCGYSHFSSPFLPNYSGARPPSALSVPLRWLFPVSGGLNAGYGKRPETRRPPGLEPDGRVCGYVHVRRYADVHVFHCASVRMRNCVCVRVCVCAIAEPTGAYRNRACPDPGECCRS